jgi:hypothetical protein
MCKLCYKEFDNRHFLKQECITYKGGSCIKCGYSKCIAALEFHHRDLQQKDIQISSLRHRKLNPMIEKELDKCDLLCANCHRETHAELNSASVA